MFFNPTSNLADINLDLYETLFTEPLHDISNHIQNLYAELPFQMEKEHKKSFTDIINVSFNGKIAKNSSDYRKSILIVTKWFHDNCSNHVFKSIFLTLCEIREILNSPDKSRSPQSVLSLYLILFIHMILIKINIRDKLRKLTARKFFGSYFHSLVHHSALQYRIVSGRTANTEKEEATFNSLKTFTNITSNHHSDQVVTNALIRTQAKEQLHQQPFKSSADEKNFKNLYLPLKELLNDTIIPFAWMKKYFSDFQTLLQNISDYLLDKTKWWVEEEFGIRFLNISKCSNSKKVNHFRSSSIKAEEEFLKDCWQKCLDNKGKLIRAYKITLNDRDVLLKTMDFFSDQQVTQDVSNNFSNNLPNKTLNSHTSNITFENEMCVAEELTPESSLIKENKFPPLTRTEQGSDLNKTLSTLSNTSITTDFTISPPAHESTPIKPIKTKRKPIGNLENIIEFKAEKPMSNTATMLQKVIGNDLLVLTYDRAQKN